ncbi:hypothetical protein SpCBS45565_g02821 [Spizellomyces sp. 'palustris']|nr:hypothetical protein SpCBS45565_g02821 [Spizellomyces sp. 'palustris']
MLSEIAVTASSSDTAVQICDLRSGVVLGSLKGNKSDPKTTATLPMPAAGGTLFSSSFLAAQNDRALVHLWSWSKGQLHTKFVLPEKLCSMEVSHSGEYCVGGGYSGRVYVWQLNSGRLIRMFDAHYKAVRVVRFSSDDVAFITGGEDAVANVWLLSRVLDPNSESVSSPHRSLSGHALPISDIVFGVGLFANSRLFTTSIDRTCKIWEAASGELLATIVFPKAISSLVVDVTETRLYAGATEGTIYQTNLYSRNADGDTVGLRKGAVEDADADGGTLLGHSQGVTSLALSLDGSLLLSGSEDCTAIVWDTTSRQCLRTLSNHKAPVTDVKILLRPPHLMDPGVSNEHFPSLRPWKRHEIAEEVDAPVRDREEWTLPACSGVVDDALEEFQKGTLTAEQAFTRSVEERVRQMGLSNGGNSIEAEMSRLRGEVERLADHNKALVDVNEEFYQAAVSHLIRDVRR